MARLIYALLFCSIYAGPCQAQPTCIHVLPWNGQSAAVSITFDDARPVQLDLAIPELNKRHLRATFFVVVSKLTRLDEWRRAQLAGHEIGNHSVSHQHANALTRETEETQVEDAKRFLDSNFKSDITIFAYPYDEISPGLRFWVEKYDFAARGWQGNGGQAYVTPEVEPDWHNLPSQPIYTKYEAAVYKAWIDEAVSRHAWTTLQIHGIGDASTGFEPISISRFLYLLDYLKGQQAKGLWVAPFGEVAAYLRGQKILEAARPHITRSETRLTWQVPTPFPPGVLLKVVCNSDRHVRLYQGGRQLRRSKDGTYSVSFEAQELTVRDE